VTRIRVALMCLLLPLLVAVGARADVVEGLHAATIPVANQSAESLAKAAREALSEVLVKVSGSSEVLRNPAVVKALGNARNQVQQYAYLRNKAPGGGQAVQFDFDPGYIKNLVLQAGAPFWTANRPEVLAWVVVEDAQGKHFVSPDSAPEQAQLLADEFSRRGVPLQFPVFDLVDTTAMSPDDAWRLDAATVQAASARYNLQDILVGRLTSVTEGQAAGDWAYFYQTERIDRAVNATDQQAFFRDGVDVVAGGMAARYAVAPTAGPQGGVSLSVSGVSTYADYAAIVKWLEGLELVEQANLVQVQGDRIELRLKAQVDATQLAAMIGLNDRFLPLPAPAPMAAPTAMPAPAPEPGVQPVAQTGTPLSTQPGTQLSYQWRK
jgi:hypothetical protein